MEKENVNFPLKSGASLVKTRPIFSPDSKFLFVCSGSLIKVYSVQSGECVHELKGHTNYVTGLAIHPKNKLQLLSCSLDQKIIVWDYTDGIFLRDIHLTSSIHGIYTVESEDKVYILQQDITNKRVSNLTAVFLSKQSGRRTCIVYSPCSNDSRKTTVDPKGSFVATVQGTKLLWRFFNTGKFFRLEVDSKTQFTCVVSHPTQDRITTGCSDGKIYMWYERRGDVVNSSFHWHSLPVKDLCYTVEGSYLLSGGHECVLVKWHPESGYKDFLPRLGAPLNHIVCSRDNLFYAVCQDDNVVQVITSNLVIQNIYQGLTRCYIQNKVTEPFPAGMKFDPKSKALVLNGKPGHVQFYSVHEDKQLFNLDIVCQNYISSESVDSPLAVTDVVQMAFNSTGTWLATVEYWNDGIMTPEMRLKFWFFNDEKQSFVLNTSVETPHDGSVNALKFRPFHEQSSLGMQHLAVTSSNDEKFKIWNLVDDTDIYRTNEKWTCEAVGFYRNLPAGQADFSDDGSLLAVGFGPNVTLWNPENNLLKRTLSNALSQDPIKHVKFGQYECSHYLVSTTDNVLTVWNLITCTVIWSTDVNIVCLTKDPCTDSMAAFTHLKELIVFRPSSPHPVFSASSVSTTSVLSATFVPHHKKSCYEKTTLSWQNKSELYFINKDQELLCVSLEKDSKSVRKEKDAVTLKQNLPQSALSLLVGRHSNKNNQRDTQNRVDQLPNEKFTREMLSSAAHVQPSVMSLCRPFIQSLLISAQSGGGTKTDDSDDDDDGAESADEKLDTQTMSQDSGLEVDMETDEVKTPQERQDTISDLQLSKIVSSDLSWYGV